MKGIELNGKWQFKSRKDQDWLEAYVPGTLYTDLLRLGKMKDPFYGENEEEVKALSELDYEYKRSFEVSEALLTQDKIVLECKGIDTIAEIFINKQSVGKTQNMHRTYEFDVKGILEVGINEIHIIIDSPLQYIKQKDEEKSLWGVSSTVPGYQHIRKAHCAFGWDWGPQLPDMGIFREIAIKAYSEARLTDLYVKQQHSADGVRLGIEVEIEKLTSKELLVECQISDAKGQMVAHTYEAANDLTAFNINIESPELWWPNGYGKQPLYEVKVILKNEDKECDVLRKRIGLRTLRIKKEKDQWGEGFCFEINGLSIFALGANYIPEDNLMGRNTLERTRRILETCIRSNFNCIRVWGGAYYAEDYFYDLCDELGLIVWQDFMFACAVYNLTEDFKDNIMAEFEDNIRRLRNHASLGLWCGNNEMESAWCYWGLPEDQKLRLDYLKMFEEILPEMVRKFDPQRFYWPSSPSSGGGFFEPSAQDKGDAHYWDVWHGKKPFEDFENQYFRFASEYGFQSFPSMKTIRTFAEEKDFNIYSPVMEQHQKCIDNGHGNATIMYYMAQYYPYPKNFEMTLYASQILQGDCLKVAIEHWRRNRGRCMGSTYWQLNDCWPVASWATIDYFGRWKASQYYVKRAYAPVLISAKAEEGGCSLYITNDTLEVFKGEVSCQIVHQTKGVLHEEVFGVTAESLSVRHMITIPYQQYITNRSDERNIYIVYKLYSDKVCISSDTLLLVKPKQFEFKEPGLKVDIVEYEDHFGIKVKSDVFARRVGIEFKEIDTILEDNYFDVYPNIVKEVKLMKTDLDNDMTREMLQDQIKLTSVYDLM